MLTATIDVASAGSGADRRYIIVAQVLGNSASEVKAFYKAWAENEELDFVTKVTPCTFSVEIVSPGWSHVRTGREAVAGALKKFDVQVDDGTAEETP